MWYNPESNSFGWSDSLDLEGGGVTCFIMEYGYPSDPHKYDSNDNGINDLR